MLKNIDTIYNNILSALVINNKSPNDLSQFTGDEFLEAFGPEFQKQLSAAGKETFAILKQTDISPVQEKFNAARETHEKIFTETRKEFLTTFRLDPALSNAQAKLNRTKENLLKDLTGMLNTNGLVFTTDDKDKIKAAFNEHLNKNYNQLNDYLEKWKTLLPSTFAKLQFHSDNISIRNKQQKNINFTVEPLPALEELKVPTKPESKIGRKVDIENIKKQIRIDIANGKNDIVLRLIDAEDYAMFKKISDIGIQHRTPALALLYLLILFLLRGIYNNKNRIVKALEELIQEGHQIDLSKIRFKATSPATSDEKGKITQEVGPLDVDSIKRLQSIMDKRNEDLSEHHRQLLTNKKPGSITPTSSDSGYNSETEEEEVIPYLRSRGP